MGFLNPPSAPSASEMTAAQTQSNRTAINQSQAAQGQSFGPYQNITQAFGPIDPETGLRRLNTTTTLSPENQPLYAQLTGNRAQLGSGIGNLIGNYYNQLSNAPDLSTAAGSLTNQMLGRHLGYLDPYFQREDNALQNRLNNQGATDNARAFAEMRQGDNRARNVMQAINAFEPMAFSQALQNYQTPLNTIQQFMGMIGPYIGQQADPTAYQAQVVDAAGNMQRAYQNELQQYQNMWSGIGSLGAGIMNFPLGTAAGAVPTIGTRIGSGIGSMFS